MATARPCRGPTWGAISAQRVGHPANVGLHPGDYATLDFNELRDGNFPANASDWLARVNGMAMPKLSQIDWRTTDKLSDAMPNWCHWVRGTEL